VACPFDSSQRSSDAGASLLGAIERKLKLTELPCSRRIDRRDPARIAHTYRAPLLKPIFSIALGYADGSDSARVGWDPVVKLLCWRDPSHEEGLGSQPTLSRFEHA
jgi:hypothetical protein